MEQTALVTGASGGIGLEFAKILARDGINLALVARNLEKLNNIKNELESKHDLKVTVLPGDLSVSDIPQQIFDELQKQNITVDILINNAGLGMGGPYIKQDWGKERMMLDCNMTSLCHLTKLFLPGMVERKSGKIMNVASTAAFQPGPLMACYYATKAFVLFYSEALAHELKGTGVTVTALCPGPTRTGFQQAADIQESRLVNAFKLPGAEPVAEYGIDAMNRGKVVAIPGIFNKLLVFSTRLLPRSLTTKFVHYLQQQRQGS